MFAAQRVRWYSRRSTPSHQLSALVWNVCMWAEGAVRNPWTSALCADFILGGDACEWMMSSNTGLSNCAVAPQQRHVNLELFVSVWNEHTEIFKHLRNAELAQDSTLLLVVLHWWLVGIQDDLWVIVWLQWSLPGRPLSNQLCPQARPCGTTAVIKPNFSYLVQQCVLVVFTPELSEGGILCGNCISSVLLMSTDFSETHWFKCQYCVLWSPFLLGQAL